MTVAFVKAAGTDGLLEARGPRRAPRAARRARRAVAAAPTYEITWLESDIDVGAVKLYLTAGAPSTSGEDEEGMLRASARSSPPTSALPLRAGVNRGHVFTGDIGAVDAAHLRRHGRRRQPRRAADRRAQAGEMLHGRRARARAHDVPTEVEPLLVKGKEQAILAQRVLEPTGVARAGGRHPAARRPRAGARQLAQRSTPPGCGSSGSSSSSASRASASRASCRAADARARLPAARAAGEHYATAEPYSRGGPLLRPLVGIPDTRDATSRTARAVRRGRDAGSRAVAAAARRTVRRRGAADAETDEIDRAAEPRPAARGRRRRSWSGCC